MGAIARTNVELSGDPDGRATIFAHGFVCDQHMWRFVAPAFESDQRSVRFDHVGAGGSELVLLPATGHCPNLSAPLETIDAIRAFA